MAEDEQASAACDLFFLPPIRTKNKNAAKEANILWHVLPTSAKFYDEPFVFIHCSSFEASKYVYDTGVEIYFPWLKSNQSFMRKTQIYYFDGSRCFLHAR